MSIIAIRQELAKNITTNPENIKRFFKTSEGAYSEKEEFLGISVPTLRQIAKKHQNMELGIIKELLESKYNEERLFALIILASQYKNATLLEQDKIYKFYLENIARVNNWNLVDSSAHLIIGAHLFDKDRSLIEQLAYSNNLWERRIAIVATWYFIKKQELDHTFIIAKLLLKDKEDLIHKATGWMLREAGKIKQEPLTSFLEIHAKEMPRTMLRYSIEKLNPQEREYYLKLGKK